MKPLEIKNLVKTYVLKKGAKTVQAVRDVTFSLEPGEIFGLLGPNGAGKTSIISMITTLEKPTAGDILVFNQSVQVDPLFTKMKIGVVPQEIIPQGFFNLVEILQFQSGYYGISNNQKRIEFLLKKLGLWEQRSKQIKQLSGGMKRRMMIAKALVHSPQLLLLDEPTAGVDIELRKSLWDFVLELKSEGMTILLTTHYLQEAEQLCDRVGIINHGKLALVDHTQNIIQSLTSRQVEIELVSGERKKFLIPSQQSVGEILKESKLVLESIKDIRTTEGTLEDAVMSVLKNSTTRSSEVSP